MRRTERAAFHLPHLLGWKPGGWFSVSTYFGAVSSSRGRWPNPRRQRPRRMHRDRRPASGRKEQQP